jgi:hypothetical protein
MECIQGRLEELRSSDLLAEPASQEGISHDFVWSICSHQCSFMRPIATFDPEVTRDAFYI